MSIILHGDDSIRPDRFLNKRISTTPCCGRRTERMFVRKVEGTSDKREFQNRNKSHPTSTAKSARLTLADYYLALIPPDPTCNLV